MSLLGWALSGSVELLHRVPGHYSALGCTPSIFRYGACSNAQQQQSHLCHLVRPLIWGKRRGGAYRVGRARQWVRVVHPLGGLQCVVGAVVVWFGSGGGCCFWRPPPLSLRGVRPPAPSGGADLLGRRALVRVLRGTRALALAAKHIRVRSRVCLFGPRPSSGFGPPAQLGARALGSQSFSAGAPRHLRPGPGRRALVRVLRGTRALALAAKHTWVRGRIGLLGARPSWGVRPPAHWGNGIASQSFSADDFRHARPGPPGRKA